MHRRRSARTTTERGYGVDHQRERRHHEPRVNRGEAECNELVCLEVRDGRSRWIMPGTAWDLAHDRANGGYLGPAHARCNRAEAARFKNSGGTTPALPPHGEQALNRWAI